MTPDKRQELVYGGYLTRNFEALRCFGAGVEWRTDLEIILCAPLDAGFECWQEYERDNIPFVVVSVKNLHGDGVKMQEVRLKTGVVRGEP